jgi:uncharacterized protein (DUF4415 family)
MYNLGHSPRWFLVTTGLFRGIEFPADQTLVERRRNQTAPWLPRSLQEKSTVRVLETKLEDLAFQWPGHLGRCYQSNYDVKAFMDGVSFVAPKRWRTTESQTTLEIHHTKHETKKKNEYLTRQTRTCLDCAKRRIRSKHVQWEKSPSLPWSCRRNRKNKCSEWESEWISHLRKKTNQYDQSNYDVKAFMKSVSFVAPGRWQTTESQTTLEIHHTKHETKKKMNTWFNKLELTSIGRQLDSTTNTYSEESPSLPRSCRRNWKNKCYEWESEWIPHLRKKTNQNDKSNYDVIAFMKSVSFVAPERWRTTESQTTLRIHHAQPETKKIIYIFDKIQLASIGRKVGFASNAYRGRESSSLCWSCKRSWKNN